MADCLNKLQNIKQLDEERQDDKGKMIRYLKTDCHNPCRVNTLHKYQDQIFSLIHVGQMAMMMMKNFHFVNLIVNNDNI